MACLLVYDVVMPAGRTLTDEPEPKQRVHEVTDVTVEFLMHGLAAPTK
jgi:hypothetical protein